VTSILFLVPSLVVGLAILELAQILLPSLARVIFALVLGLIFNTLIIFIASLFLKFSIINTLLLIFLISVPSLIYLIRKSSFPSFFEEVEIKKNWYPVLGFSFISIFIILIFTQSIFVSTNGIITGNRLVWTDWPVHIAIVSSFLEGENFPPQNPLYAGPLISYPFFSDFLSSIFQILGANLKTSLILPAIALSLSAMYLIYFFGLLITEKKKSAITGLFIGIFWGGLGFVYFISDLASSPNFAETLKFPPYEYTFYQAKNLWFFSFLYAELLAQRAFLFGLPMFFIALIILILGLARRKKLYLFLAGLIVAIMPFFHMHSYISLLLFCAIFFPINLAITFKQDGIIKTAKQLKDIILYFFLPIIGLGLIQLPVILSINLNQTIGFNWGWMKNQENFFLFWFKNTGFFWPLWIFAILKIKMNPLAKNIAIASTILFILPNVFRFAPWAYDNLKIMTYWYLLSAPLVGAAIVTIYQKGIFGKLLATALFISLIASGVIEDARILNTQKTQISLWSKKDFELANSIIKNTEPRSIILTAAIHDHPATALAGRKIIIGFPGNAWSWGYSDWQKREQDVREIFQGNPITAPILLEKYQVDYVLISPRERVFEPRINENYFLQKLEQVTKGPDYRIFKVK